MLTFRFGVQIDMLDEDSAFDMLYQFGEPISIIGESASQLVMATDLGNTLTITGSIDTSSEEALLDSTITGMIFRDPGGNLLFSMTGMTNQTFRSLDDGSGEAQFLQQIAGGVVVHGSTYADALAGDAGNDALNGNGGADSLMGLGGNDTLSGGSGNDTLNGGVGNDTMSGGAGNDAYYVASAQDQVIESAGAGTDLVYSTSSYTLGANVENLNLLGAQNLNGTGNSQGNSINGNVGNNTLNGGGGNDTLNGGVGNDLLGGGDGHDALDGSSGNDTLNGGGDNDTLNGGAGNDLLGGGDGHDALDGGSGNDTLNGENGNDSLLGLTGLDTLNGDAGNDTLDGGDAADTLNGGDGSDNLLGVQGNDTLNGGAGNDKLDGGSGNDVMSGGGGSDRYFVDNVLDQVMESLNAGTDKIISSVSLPFLPANVENLQLTGSADLNADGNLLDNDLVGNAGGNELDGRKGNDTIHLGQGADTGIGGEGSDRFVLDAAFGVGEADTITDFAPGTDKLVLENGIFTQLGAGPLSSDQFILTTDTPTGGDDYLVYDQASGNLYYDAAGTGNTAVLIATFSNDAALTAADIDVI